MMAKGIADALKEKEAQIKQLQEEAEADRLLLKTFEKDNVSRPMYRTWFGRGIGHVLRTVSAPFARLNEEAELRLEFPDEVEAAQLLDEYSALAAKGAKTVKSKRLVALAKKLIKVQLKMENLEENGVLQPESYRDIENAIRNCKAMIRDFRNRAGQVSSAVLEIPLAAEDKVEEFTRGLINMKEKEDDSNGGNCLCTCDSDHCGSDNNLQQTPEEDQAYSD